MEGPVYPSRLTPRKIAYTIPEEAQRVRMNEIIFDELVNGKFTAESRAYFRKVTDGLKAKGCDAVALVCTEIPLLVSEGDSSLPTLDSTRLLARAALRRAIE
jgi:aspartate racemase